jgi:hypothetical protein
LKAWTAIRANRISAKTWDAKLRRLVGQPVDGSEQCQVFGFWHGLASMGLSQPVAQVHVDKRRMSDGHGVQQARSASDLEAVFKAEHEAIQLLQIPEASGQRPPDFSGLADLEGAKRLEKT